MIIREELLQQERSVSWFARKIHMDRSNVYRLFEKTSLDTELLRRISHVLQRDFFMLYSETYRCEVMQTAARVGHEDTRELPVTAD